VLSLCSWGAGDLPGGLAGRTDCTKKPMPADVRVCPRRPWWRAVTATEHVVRWSAAGVVVGEYARPECLWLVTGQDGRAVAVAVIVLHGHVLLVRRPHAPWLVSSQLPLNGSWLISQDAML
jgi:hypothetical protein